ncbi:hypothetical protein C8R45DRAFT_955367 [Mycena sanguinolenta]|nr:hypothetical protein C8R45DRAFT_955367 [Mycena sanguinolenta]
MALQSNAKRIYSADASLSKVASTSDNDFTSASSSRRPKQIARKSTGGLPPRKMLQMESSLSRSSNSAVQNRSPRQPIDGLLSSQSTRTGRSKPSSSAVQRTSQTARKSTGRTAPQKRSEDSPESSSLAHNLPLPPVSAHEQEPITSCDLCSFSLPTPSHSTNDPSHPIRDLLTVCQHHFHYTCYMHYLTTASVNSWTSCPQCQTNLLTNEKYWMHVTTHNGTQCYTDLTEEIEERRRAVRLARQQIFFDSLGYGHLNAAAALLAGSDPVDINFRAPLGGRTPLHFSAMRNDADSITFLLNHGADRHQRDDAGLLAIDYARSCNALNAAERLA